MSTCVMANRAGDYLSFKLGDQVFGIEILRIKEVVCKTKIVPLPKTPDYVDGVLNLRGQLFPVVNLRARLGLPRVEDNSRTCIVVVEATSPDMEKCWEVKQCGKTECPAYEAEDRRCWMLTGTHCKNEIQGSFIEKKEACSKCGLFINAIKDRTVFDVGVVVDAVCEVLSIADSDIDDCPEIATGSGDHFIMGIARHEEEVVSLLDVAHTLGGRIRVPEF